LLGLIANVAVFVVVVDIVGVFAFIVAVDAVVKVTEVAKLAICGHIVGHGLMAGVWLPAWEWRHAGSRPTGREGTAGLRRVWAHAADGPVPLFHGGC
jgi:hypothetical protein